MTGEERYVMPDRKAKKSPADKSIEAVAEHVRRWIRSDEGRQQMAHSQRSALETTKRLQEARRVDPKTLREPMSR